MAKAYLLVSLPVGTTKRPVAVGFFVVSFVMVVVPFCTLIPATGGCSSVLISAVTALNLIVDKPLASADDSISMLLSALVKSTLSPGFTMPTFVPFARTSQPLALIALATAVVVAKPCLEDDDLPSVVENVPCLVPISNLLSLAVVVIKSFVTPTTDKR